MGPGGLTDPARGRKGGDRTPPGEREPPPTDAAQARTTPPGDGREQATIDPSDGPPGLEDTGAHQGERPEPSGVRGASSGRTRSALRGGGEISGPGDHPPSGAGRDTGSSPRARRPANPPGGAGRTERLSDGGRQADPTQLAGKGGPPDPGNRGRRSSPTDGAEPPGLPQGRKGGVATNQPSAPLSGPRAASAARGIADPPGPVDASPPGRADTGTRDGGRRPLATGEGGRWTREGGHRPLRGKEAAGPGEAHHRCRLRPAVDRTAGGEGVRSPQLEKGATRSTAGTEPPRVRSEGGHHPSG